MRRYKYVQREYVLLFLVPWQKTEKHLLGETNAHLNSGFFIWSCLKAPISTLNQRKEAIVHTGNTDFSIQFPYEYINDGLCYCLERNAGEPSNGLAFRSPYLLQRPWSDRLRCEIEQLGMSQFSAPGHSVGGSRHPNARFLLPLPGAHRY